jgi:hypothetical protein
MASLYAIPGYETVKLVKVPHDVGLSRRWWLGPAHATLSRLLVPKNINGRGGSSRLSSMRSVREKLCSKGTSSEGKDAK